MPFMQAEYRRTATREVPPFSLFFSYLSDYTQTDSRIRLKHADARVRVCMCVCKLNVVSLQQTISPANVRPPARPPRNGVLKL